MYHLIGQSQRSDRNFKGYEKDTLHKTVKTLQVQRPEELWLLLNANTTDVTQKLSN